MWCYPPAGLTSSHQGILQVTLEVYSHLKRLQWKQTGRCAEPGSLRRCRIYRIIRLVYDSPGFKDEASSKQIRFQIYLNKRRLRFSIGQSALLYEANYLLFDNEVKNVKQTRGKWLN